MKHIEDFVRTLPIVEPPSYLVAAIDGRIVAARRHSARLRFALCVSLSLAAGLSIVPVAGYVYGDLFQSGFAQYFSLLFSDSAVVLASWQPFALSLVESLPVLGFAALLSSTFVLFGSSMLATRQAKTAFSRLRAI